MKDDPDDGMPAEIELRALDNGELIDEFALALKRITSDTGRQERAWDARWYELREAILERMV